MTEQNGVGRSSATDELHRMLDEQGVGSYTHEAPAAVCLAFFDGKGWHDCWESTGGEVNVTFSMTPEQAIAATLGSCNCTNDCTNGERTGTCYNESKYPQMFFYCSECGCAHKRNRAYVDMPRFCPNCGRRIEQ